jgi:hypothetical protein
MLKLICRERKAMAKTKKQKSQKTRLVERYEEIFTPNEAWPESSDNYSLAQPSPMKAILGVATYGMHEEPILGK